MEDKIASPLKAIRSKCLDCCCGVASEVKMCSVTSCPLYNFRFGKGAKRREMTDEQRQAAAERLRKARETKNS